MPVGRGHLEGARRLAAAVAALGASAVLLAMVPLSGVQIPARQPEGVLHGFLSLARMDGSLLADGDLIQTAQGEQVTSRLVFHFRDGSLYDETTVFSQQNRIRLISDRVVQRGPAFPRPLEMSIDGRSGKVVVRYTDEGGTPKEESAQVDAAEDLVNGLVPIVLKHLPRSSSPRRLPYVVATPAPRRIDLVVTRAADDRFTIAGGERKATHYVLQADPGGLTGWLASLFGKLPPDSHVWMAEGEAPVLVRAELPLYAGGPLWRIDLARPAWPESAY